MAKKAAGKKRAGTPAEKLHQVTVALGDNAFRMLEVMSEYDGHKRIEDSVKDGVHRDLAAFLEGLNDEERLELVAS